MGVVAVEVRQQLDAEEQGGDDEREVLHREHAFIGRAGDDPGDGAFDDLDPRVEPAQQLLGQLG